MNDAQQQCAQKVLFEMQGLGDPQELGELCYSRVSVGTGCTHTLDLPKLRNKTCKSSEPDPPLSLVEL